MRVWYGTNRGRFVEVEGRADKSSWRVVVHSTVSREGRNGALMVFVQSNFEGCSDGKLLRSRASKE